MSNALPGYIAAVLDEASSAALRKLAVHPDVYCHHVTLAYRPTQEVWEKYVGMVMTRVELIAVGMKRDEKGQAVLIEGIRSENAHPHVTVSCAGGVRPNYSNELLRDLGDMTHIHIPLSALVQFIPFKS